MSDETRFELSDPDGTFLTLSQAEGRALLTDLQGDDDLSRNLLSLRSQLEEWLDGDR